MECGWVETSWVEKAKPCGRLRLTRQAESGREVVLECSMRCSASGGSTAGYAPSSKPANSRVQMIHHSVNAAELVGKGKEADIRKLDQAVELS